MYKGVWKGKYADDGTRILILGESHYCSEGDSLDTTTSVIKRFLEKDDIPFFEKIVESLGYRADERETLFDLVFLETILMNFVELVMLRQKNMHEKIAKNIMMNCFLL